MAPSSNTPVDKRPVMPPSANYITPAMQEQFRTEKPAMPDGRHQNFIPGSTNSAEATTKPTCLSEDEKQVAFEVWLKTEKKRRRSKQPRLTSEQIGQAKRIFFSDSPLSEHEQALADLRADIGVPAGPQRRRAVKAANSLAAAQKAKDAQEGKTDRAAKARAAKAEKAKARAAEDTQEPQEAVGATE